MDFFKRKKNKIPFGRPLVDSREIKSVTRVLKSGIYAHGPISSLFEKNSANSLSQNFLQQYLLALQECIYFIFHEVLAGETK